MGRNRNDKGKGKTIEQPKQKKSKTQKEWDRALAAVDAYNRQEGFVIRDETTPPTRRSTRTRASGRSGSTPSSRSGGRKRVRQELEAVETQQQQSEQSAQSEQQQQSEQSEPQPPAQGEVRLLDLTSCKGPRIKRLRFVPVEEWFPEVREEGIDPRFWTVVQESFYRSFGRKSVQLSQHRTLRWEYLQSAAGGADVRRHFDAFPGLTALLTQVDRYVGDWVRVFYATVWIAPDRSFIQFMFQGEVYKLYRADMLEALRLQESTRFLHEVVHPNAHPPRRPLTGGVFPTDDEICLLFRSPFPPGSLRLPEMLTPEARAVHFALRRSLLPRIGNAEAITSIQQWLLLSILTHQQFDILDLILCEIEDNIAEGLGRQQPFAHFISYLLARSIHYPEHLGVYQQTPKRFPDYIPSAPTDRRRGQRAMAQAQRQIPAEERDRVAAEDQALAEAEAELPHAFIDLDDDDSDSEDIEFIPPLPRRHDAEAGGSTQGAPQTSVPSSDTETATTEPSAAVPSEITLILRQMQQQQAAQAEDARRREEQQFALMQSLQQQQQAMFAALQADRENNARLFSVLFQAQGLQLPAPAPASAPAPSHLPGSVSALLRTPGSDFPLSALLASGVYSLPAGMSQRPVLPSLTSPIPTGPLSFEDTPQPTVPEQQQPVISPHVPQLSVVPSSVAEPALDAPDAALQSVQDQIVEATAAAGHSSSSSDSEADGSQFVVAPSSTPLGPPSSPAPAA